MGYRAPIWVPPPKTRQACPPAQVELLLLDLDAIRDLTVDPAKYPGLPLPEAVIGEQPADRLLVAALLRLA